jgi:topoisomerase-4 subunit A
MHGNNGSIDGDSPAAMRYTECRLSEYGQTLIQNIKKNTVPFINNFDDSEQEPTLLPTLLPNLLINGATGIAAGYATNMPPFNPSEVVDAIITRIDSPTGYLSTILKIMPGPDFPTGGIILEPEGIKKAYETGKGKITIRARIDEKSSRHLYITEIPYETNRATIIRDISELAAKHETLNIDEVRDESDANGISIAIDLKSGKNVDFTKDFLLKNTQLQVSYNINMVAIRDRKPQQLPILNFLDAFIEHANGIIVAASKYDLAKAKERQEIVQGLIKAIKILDDVVNLIRKSSDKQSAIAGLINKMAFTDKQAEAIVNLRLYRLSSNDVSELNKELGILQQTISELELLIKNKDYRNSYLKNKLRDYKKKFGYKRKTSISSEEAKINIDITDVIEDRENIVLITRDGYLKNMTKRSYSNSEVEQSKIKEMDLPVAQFISNQRDKVILITSKGNYISIPTYKIENTKLSNVGIHLNTIIVNDPDDKIINAFNYDNNLDDERCLIIATKKGMIKRTLIKDLNITKFAKISTIMNLDEGDEIISCVISSNSTNENEMVGVITKLGMGVKYPTSQINVVGRGAAGVKNVSLRDNDEVASIFIDDNKLDFVLIASNQGSKRIHRDQLPIGNRTNVGKSLISQIKSNPIMVISAFEVNMNDLINHVSSDGS